MSTTQVNGQIQATRGRFALTAQRSSRNILAIRIIAMTVAIVVCVGCSNGSSGGDAGAKNSLGANSAVAQKCQMCLTQSTSNDCSSKQRNCTSDSVCAQMNTCVNNCCNGSCDPQYGCN